MTLQSKLAMGWDKHTVVKFSQRSDVHIFAFSFRSGIRENSKEKQGTEQSDKAVLSRPSDQLVVALYVKFPAQIPEAFFYG